MSEQNLSINILANTSDVEKGMSKVQSEVKEIKKKFQGLEDVGKKIGKGLGTAFKGAATAMAAVATAAIAVSAGIAKVVNNTLDAADRLQQMSDVTGISAERLQELEYIGNNVGVSLDTMTGAEKKLIKTMGDAKSGSEAAATAFATLGVKTTDANGNLRNSQDVMNDVNAALAKMPNETERNALAMDIYGKSAMDLNPLIKANADEIAKLTEEAKKNGTFMSNEEVAALDATGDAIGNLGAQFKAVGGKIAVSLLPSIDEIVKAFAPIPALIGDAVKTGDWSKVGKGIADALSKSMNGILKMITTITNLAVGIITALVSALVQAIPVVLPLLANAVVQIITVLANLLATNAAMLINTAVLVIMTLIQGLVEAAPILVDAAVSMLGALVDSISANLPLLIEAAKDMLMAIVNGIINNLDKLIEGALELISAYSSALIEYLPVLIKAAIQIVLALVKGIVDNLDKIITGAVELVNALVDAIVDNIDLLIDAAIALILALQTGLIENLPLLLKAAIQIIIALAAGLIQAIPKLLMAIPKLYMAIFENIKKMDWIGIGGNIIKVIADGIVNGINSLLEATKKTFTGVKDTISNILDRIKKLFDFKWEFPKLKMPHFSVSGSFNLAPPSVPKLGIDWYSRGGIFTRPSILGGVGVGDASNGSGSGMEAVLPLDRLPQLLGLDKDGGKSITINLNGNYSFRDKEDMEFFMNRMALAARRV